MDDYLKTKWGINVVPSTSISLGIGLIFDTQDALAYIYINFIKWHISIGKVYDYGC